MKRIQHVRIEMVKEKSDLYDSNIVRTHHDAHRIVSQFLANVDREHFIVLCLDSKNKVNAINTVHVGSLSASVVHPREVFKPAILANAASVIVAHNHPSGDPTPSREDIDVTKNLQQGGEYLGIDILDHIIVGDGRFVSLKSDGYMD